MKNKFFLKVFFLSLFIGISFLILHNLGAQEDEANLTVVSTYPDDGQTDTPLSIRPSVTFNRPMDPSSITTKTFTLTTSLGEQVMGNVTYANRTASFIPFTTLNEEDSYVATIFSRVRDSKGNTLGSDYSWTFSTGMD